MVRGGSISRRDAGDRSDAHITCDLHGLSGRETDSQRRTESRRLAAADLIAARWGPGGQMEIPPPVCRRRAAPALPAARCERSRRRNRSTKAPAAARQPNRLPLQAGRLQTPLADRAKAKSTSTTAMRSLGQRHHTNEHRRGAADRRARPPHSRFRSSFLVLADAVPAAQPVVEPPRRPGAARPMVPRTKEGKYLFLAAGRVDRGTGGHRAGGSIGSWPCTARASSASAASPLRRPTAAMRRIPAASRAWGRCFPPRA